VPGEFLQLYSLSWRIRLPYAHQPHDSVSGRSILPPWLHRAHSMPARNVLAPPDASKRIQLHSVHHVCGGSDAKHQMHRHIQPSMHCLLRSTSTRILLCCLCFLHVDVQSGILRDNIMLPVPCRLLLSGRQVHWLSGVSKQGILHQWLVLSRPVHMQPWIHIQAGGHDPVLRGVHCGNNLSGWNSDHCVAFGEPGLRVNW
jgi:hypothetical protein